MKNSFRIIAIRAVHIPNGVGDSNEKKAKLIQKRVGKKSSWQYFYDHYIDLEDIHEDDVSGGYITPSFYYKPKPRLYDVNNLKVDVCAIVGRNGTGKSTLVDLLIRTINNVAAAVIGENYVFTAAEHLHYIENVYADLCYEMDGLFYVIELRGRKLMLHSYKRQKGESVFNHDESIPILDEISSTLSVITQSEDQRLKVLGRCFYTLVCNYSMYGFNYWDYMEERTPHVRLDRIYGLAERDGNETYRYPRPDKSEDLVWLKGLFYKNDGYQTPLVIHPMRTDGAINVIKENELSKERLLKTFFYRNKEGNYPLRNINGNVVNSIRLSLIQWGYSDKELSKKLGLSPKQNLSNPENYAKVSQCVYEYWCKKYDIKNGLSRLDETESDSAKNYLIYKTIKIILNYPQYRRLKRLISATNINVFEIHDAMDALYRDHSSRTRKLLRTINYITTGLFEDKVYPIEEMTERIEQYVGNNGPIDAYLPPPIFSYEFLLTNEDGDEVKFAHLSSGEKQIAYTISSFLYHVSNVDSAWDTYEDISLKYRYMNVIFDEVEQYYHPDLQRCYLSLLLQGLSCIDYKGLKGINIILVTHSPFMLSDILRDNILIMGDEKQKPRTETFCGNIVDMLDSPFFMDYSIGRVAQMKVQEIIYFYEAIVVKHGSIPNDVNNKLSRYTRIVNLIGDKYIKNSLKEMMNELKIYIEGQENV